MHRFCGMCGACLTHLCPACGRVNAPDHHFCGYCGARLAEADAASALSFTVPAAIAEPLRLEGERRTVTVMLADVCGSTDLLERVGTETWVSMMSEMFQLLETEIYRFGGQVDQFRGDGLVAFFGATAAHEDDPERAILAGLAMQAAVQRHAATLERRAGGLRLRVGINTGEVILTSVGNRQHYSEDTAMGEAITVAARMESAAEPGTVLVSAATYVLTQAAFEWQSLGEIMVKGLSTPMAVYRPLRPKADVGVRHWQMGIADLSVPLIGRDVELQTLETCVANVRNERGGVVLLMGERGMGKSFLMSKVRQHITREEALLAEVQGGMGASPQRLTWLRGQGRSYDAERPYSLWADFVARWLELRADESPEVAGARLYHRLQELLPAHAREIYAYLATLLDLPVEPAVAERLRQMDAARLQQEIFRVVYQCIEALAQHGPLVLMLNDLQWADASSIALLKHCLPLCDRAAVLWILMFRPERESPMWAFRHYVETDFPHRLTTVRLEPLGRAQSAEFVARLIGADVLPEAALELLLERAEGNPYYIEELIRGLIERGVLAREASTGGWRVMRHVESLDLPDSLQSLLRSRIDGLPPATRRVLQMAAAIGRVFWAGPLEGLVQAAWGNDRFPGSLQEHLTMLQRAQLIYEQGRVPELGIAYKFRSTLLYEVVYDGLLTAQRRTYHRHVAEYFEQHLSAESRSAYYGLLVYHYNRAGCPEREIEYVLLAARQARQVYANAEALNHYTHALELLEALETAVATARELETVWLRRFEVHAAQAEIFRLQGNETRFRQEAAAMLTLARQLPEHPTLLIDALLVQPGVSDWQTLEELHAGEPLVAQALQLARELGDRKREMRALAALAGHYYNVGNPIWLEIGETALQLARELGDRRFEVSLLTAVGEIFAISDPRRSMEYLELALPICQELGDKMAQIELLQLLGTLLENGGDYYRRLKECHEPQLQLCREIGFRNGESYALMFVGQIRGIYLGDFEGGLAALQKSLELATDAPEALIFRVLRIVQLYIEQGRLTEAQGLLEPTYALEAVLKAPQRPGISYEASHDMLTFAQLGCYLVWMMLCNAIADVQHLRMVPQLAQRVQTLLSDDSPFAKQYLMVARVKLAQTYLKLAALEIDVQRRQQYVAAALAASQAALETYEIFGFVRPIESTEQELLYTHHLALKASGIAGAHDFLVRAHQEMMRKHALIPEHTPYYRMYLENLSLHRELRAAYAMSIAQIQWDGSRIRVQLEG